MKGLITVLAVLVVLGIGFLLYSSPSAPPEMTETERSQIKAEVDSLTTEWWEAWETFDWDRGFSFIEDAPETTWTGAVRTVYSLAEMREVWPPAMAGLGRQDLEFTNSRTVVLGPDIVWTLREGDYVLMDTAGAVVAEGQFNETAVWVKRGGEWKLLLGHDDDTTLSDEAPEEG
jgi:hypothetical protein